MNLLRKLLVRLVVGLFMCAALLFIPAGSLRYWQGWIFLAVFFIPAISFSFYLYKHDPQLLERRLQMKEKISEQRFLVTLVKVVSLGGFVLASLDYRLGWSRHYLGAEPPWLKVLSPTLVLAGLLLMLWVFAVNSFASRTIQVEAGQKVISGGPYRLVRHPMYLGSVVMWLATPLALGSYFASPAFALLLPFYVFRLLNEEKVLRRDLPGYPEYCNATHYRLVPLVW
jgi:protein-S-isoprenylcysteine O-methyltransferase Ste14